MVTFFKANIASLSASALDYLVTFLVAQCFHVHSVSAFDTAGDVMDYRMAAGLTASVAGTVAGGVLNFYMGRVWVFHAQDRATRNQAIRYLLVWVGNFALTTAGVYLLLKGGVHYLLAKVAVSVLMGLTYNYLLQKRFVFK
jgi:putative flippase GtrA